MKVFISWSGERSKQVAELFKIWLKCVLQASDPWVSTQDIESGSLWFTEIGNQLAETSIGIICLTKENKDKPWILFEAGALTKGLSTSRVIPVLVDLRPQDINPPLSQLNGILPEESGLYSLAKTINLHLKEGQLTSDVFDRVFKTYWPQFSEGYAKILKDTPDQPEGLKREEGDILSEILLTVRGFDKRIRKLENSKSGNHLTQIEQFNIEGMDKIVEATILKLYKKQGTLPSAIEIISDLDPKTRATTHPDVLLALIDGHIERYTDELIKLR